MKASILHYFDQNKPFKLTADVSQSGLGAALLQHKRELLALGDQ